jgi:hypothetical protein
LTNALLYYKLNKQARFTGLVISLSPSFGLAQGEFTSDLLMSLPRYYRKEKVLVMESEYSSKIYSIGNKVVADPGVARLGEKKGAPK